MDRAQALQASAVLRALADLAPSAEHHPTGLSIPTEWFRWLPAKAARLFGATEAIHGQILIPEAIGNSALESRAVALSRKFAERLAAVDQLRTGERTLRAGWLFVAGTEKVGASRTRPVFHPLVTMGLRVRRGPVTAVVIPTGDAQISPLVKDRDLRRSLEESIELGGGALNDVQDSQIPIPLLTRLTRLQHFAKEAAAAAGLPATIVVPATAGPDELMRSEGLVIVAGVAVYAGHEDNGFGQAGSLRTWAQNLLGRTTSFHSLYIADEEPAVKLMAKPVLSPFLLTPRQEEAVRSSRAANVTVVSGAPGTGKSHTIAAIACDAIGRGERVLVAARSEATVDALIDLLDRSPGPQPVVFGSNERRDALAQRLSWGQTYAASEESVIVAAQQVEQSQRSRTRLRAAIADRLTAEVNLGSGPPADAARVAPAFFVRGADLGEAEPLVEACRTPAVGWLERRRRRQTIGRLRQLAGASDRAGAEALVSAFHGALIWQDSCQLEAEGGLEIGRAWDELEAAEDVARHDVGRWLELDSRSAGRLTRSALGAVAALATALRSGRGARREQLLRLDDSQLTRALPLWIGTLADIDDLLPPIPAVFDLVILDEASSIDQPLAAPALLRGRRVVIAGDPHQLRHVSFLSDDHTREVLTTHQLDSDPVLAARLDVRRNSLYDVAAGVVPVLVLDEHFRCRPHLIDFVSRRLYGGQVKVATRSPRTQSTICIEVVRLKGERDDEGVVADEVDRAIDLVEGLERSGVRSVGIVTPFRAQADALERAALQAFTADELEAMDLRIGTVHGFQGNERDLVIISMGVGVNAPDQAWTFIEDEHLFAVLATRARKRVIVLVSGDPPVGGLVAGYLEQADHPPPPPQPAEPVGRWAAAIASDLESAGVDVITAYPAGRHEVDICLQDPRRSVGIECSVHPAGAEAHIDRHLALRRAGWDLREAYPSKWGERRGELVVGLLADIRPPS